MKFSFFHLNGRKNLAAKHHRTFYLYVYCLFFIIFTLKTVRWLNVCCLFQQESYLSNNIHRFLIKRWQKYILQRRLYSFKLIIMLHLDTLKNLFSRNFWGYIYLTYWNLCYKVEKIFGKIIQSKIMEVQYNTFYNTLLQP